MLLGVIAGSLLPLQNAVNTRVARIFQSIILATTLSFISGTIVLGAIFLAFLPNPHWVDIYTQEPIWIWFGGLFGVLFFLALILLMKYFGASVAIVFAVCGQVIGGLLIDTLGLLEVTPQALPVLHLVGALLVIIGAVTVTISGRVKNANGQAPFVPPVLRILLPIAGILAGCLSAAQTTINGRLGQLLGSPITATFVSFASGLFFILLLILVIRSRIHVPTATKELTWWMWVGGGVLGATFVLTNALDAPLLGTALTVSVVLLGQILGGLTIDHYGILGTPQRRLTIKKCIGALGVLVGVILIRFS